MVTICSSADSEGQTRVWPGPDPDPAKPSVRARVWILGDPDPARPCPSLLQTQSEESTSEGERGTSDIIWKPTVTSGSSRAASNSALGRESAIRKTSVWTTARKKWDSTLMRVTAGSFMAIYSLESSPSLSSRMSSGIVSYRLWARTRLRRSVESGTWKEDDDTRRTDALCRIFPSISM